MRVEEIIVADSSPLIALARVNHLELLQKMAKTVFVPPAVWSEITIERPDAPGARELAGSSWIKVQSATQRDANPATTELDAGEAEAIALALELPGAVLLVDDLRARRVASQLQLAVIGTVGLLLRARKAALVPALRPILSQLQQCGIYLRPGLIQAALREVGE